MDVTELLDRDAVHQSGGVFTSVYYSRHRDGRAVAIKTPKFDSWRKRLPKVLDIWAKCNHPNIVQLIGKATFRGELAAVYEWHEYGYIRDYLKHHPMADPYQLSAQICDGLSYLHANDIIHGNLHSHQILVSSDGFPRIQLSVRASSTIMDAVEDAGLAVWSAPELSREGSKRTLASDVFALGMIILETITWEDSYSRHNVYLSVYEGVVKGALPLRPTDKIPENEAGNAVWDILCKCWSYNPKDRPSAQNVCDILVVKEDTTVQDLVSYFQRRGLVNYTELLYSPNAISIQSVADTALANVHRVELFNQQPVAVKRVKHNTPYKRLKRAARELDCWSSYQHPNILPVLGFAVSSTDLAMVSPWMNNGCVTDYVKRYPDCDRLLLCMQLAQVIAFLHENNVVHGDIKGPNVLISDQGMVQVTDFGVSIADHQEIEFSVTSSGRGTQRWQAPEILQGETDSSKEADIYALGMTMIEIYTGEQPYGSANWFQLMIPVITGQLRPSRPISLPINEIGNGIWGLMNYCWTGNPNERQTSGWVYQWLQYYASSSLQLGGV